MAERIGPFSFCNKKCVDGCCLPVDYNVFNNFLKRNRDEVIERVNEAISGEITDPSEFFRFVTEGLGVSSTHASGKRLGENKEGINTSGRRTRIKIFFRKD